MKDEEQSRPYRTPTNRGLKTWIHDELFGSTQWTAITAITEDADIVAFAGLTGSGLVTRTGDTTYTVRTLAAPAAGFTITNPAGTAGNPTFVLANDLAALEALSGTNTIYYRSAADTWTAVTIGDNLTFSGGTLSAAGGAWELIESRAVDGNEDFTGLAGYREIMIDIDSVTASATGIRSIRVSTDNGSNFLDSSGDYELIAGNGAESAATLMNLHQTAGTAAASGVMLIHNFNSSSPKIAVSPGIVTTGGLWRIPTASALNAIRLVNSDDVTGTSLDGTPTGGTCRVWGKPA